MELVELPRTGRRTSRTGFGCTALMTSLDERRSLRLLDAAYDAGIRHFDVAPVYGIGDAERCLGRFLRRHDDVTVATKVGVPVPRRRPGTGAALALARGPVGGLAKTALTMIRGGGGSGGAGDEAPVTGPLPDEPITTAWARSSLDASLRNLAVDRVDLFLLHEAAVERLTDPTLHAWLEQRAVQGDLGAFGIATQRAAAERLLDDRPELCEIVQTDWDVLGADELPERPFPVVFRSVGFVLGRLRRHLAAAEAEPGRITDLSRNPTLLGDVLVRAGSVRAGRGISLFSSKNPDRILANAIAAESAALDPYVEALRNWLHEPDRRTGQ